MEELILILVNLKPGASRGWDIFFKLKGRVPGIPVLLYVMEQLRYSAVKWIVNAVADAVAEMGGFYPTDSWRESGAVRR